MTKPRGKGLKLEPDARLSVSQVRGLHEVLASHRVPINLRDKLITRVREEVMLFRYFDERSVRQPQPAQVRAELAAVAKSADKLRRSMLSLSDVGRTLMEEETAKVSDDLFYFSSALEELQTAAESASSRVIPTRPGPRPQLAMAQALSGTLLAVVVALEISEVHARTIASELLSAAGVPIPVDDEPRRELLKLASRTHDEERRNR